LDEKKVEEILEKVITSAGLEKKSSYSKEEAEKIVERLIAEGGFVEFVGRNIKASLILGK
jgi:ethanolamine ammonia-lyase small subunit